MLWYRNKKESMNLKDSSVFYFCFILFYNTAIFFNWLDIVQFFEAWIKILMIHLFFCFNGCKFFEIWLKLVFSRAREREKEIDRDKKICFIYPCWVCGVEFRAPSIPEYIASIPLPGPIRLIAIERGRWKFILVFAKLFPSWEAR